MIFYTSSFSFRLPLFSFAFSKNFIENVSKIKLFIEKRHSGCSKKKRSIPLFWRMKVWISLWKNLGALGDFHEFHDLGIQLISRQGGRAEPKDKFFAIYVAICRLYRQNQREPVSFILKQLNQKFLESPAIFLPIFHTKILRSQ